MTQSQSKTGPGAESAMPLPEHAVEVRGLDKVYRGSGKNGAKHALIEVDLTIPRGALFGLLGPNGAGKSTLINILAGLVNKTGGRAMIWGSDIDENPRQARAAIGVVPQELNIDPFFTPRELLELQAGLYGVPPHERRTGRILADLRLTDKAEAYARTLSGGMRRRLMVAKAMVHDPPVLVLDEPTAGVDVELRQQLWAHVSALNRRGTTVLLTTHYLEEAEELCDRIAIINHGQVIACDTTKALLRRLDNKARGRRRGARSARALPARAARPQALAVPLPDQQEPGQRDPRRRGRQRVDRDGHEHRGNRPRGHLPAAHPRRPRRRDRRPLIPAGCRSAVRGPVVSQI
jgi:ABC-2 type transport system ATP-binding protein